MRLKVQQFKTLIIHVCRIFLCKLIVMWFVVTQTDVIKSAQSLYCFLNYLFNCPLMLKSKQAFDICTMDSQQSIILFCGSS